MADGQLKRKRSPRERNTEDIPQEGKEAHVRKRITFKCLLLPENARPHYFMSAPKDLSWQHPVSSLEKPQAA